MKKKGFTLVELLAVIAILAVLVIIALPNVLKLFRNAKQNTFITEVQNLVRSAEDKYLTSSMLNGNNTCFDSSTNKLDMTGRDDLVYVIKLTKKGKVTEVKVADNSYQLIASSSDGINKADIGNKYGVTIVDPKTTIVGCDSTALKQESEDKKLVIKKDNEEIRTIQMGRNTTTTIDKESSLSLITCNNGVEVKEENGQLKLSNILSNSVCTFSNDLSSLINNLDDTQNNMLLINDLDFDKQVTINNPLTIDMNGKSINLSFSGHPIINDSNLTIKNNSLNDSSITSLETGIKNNATLMIDKIKIISKNTIGRSAIYNAGNVVIKNSHIEGPFGLGGNDNPKATFDIYDSEIIGTINNGIQLDTSSPNGNIYNSTITGENNAINSNSSGTINIYSGTFTGKKASGIYNASTGTINICSGEISGAINDTTYDLNNASTGTINYTSKVTLKNNAKNGTNINLTDGITCE